MAQNKDTTKYHYNWNKGNNKAILFSLKPPSNSTRKQALRIQKIFEADTVIISIHITACFGGGDYVLSIIKENDLYKYMYTEGNLRDMDIKFGILLQTAFLKIKKIFMNGICFDNSWMCTTCEYFTATGSNRAVTFADDRCEDSDDSQTKLEKAIFGK